MKKEKFQEMTSVLQRAVIDDLIHWLKGTHYFTKLDVR
jgi:hypothetical protein